MVAWAANMFAQLSGMLGGSLVGMLLVIAALEAGYHRRMDPIIWAIGGGAFFYGVSWVMANWLQNIG